MSATVVVLRPPFGLDMGVENDYTCLCYESTEFYS